MLAQKDIEAGNPGPGEALRFLWQTVQLAANIWAGVLPWSRFSCASAGRAKNSTKMPSAKRLARLKTNIAFDLSMTRSAKQDTTIPRHYDSKS